MASAPPVRPKRSRRRLWITIGVIALLVVACGGGALALSRSGNGNTAASPGWTTANVQTGPIDATVGATGTVEPLQSAELRFSGDGQVTAILVNVGDAVSAGQALARLDPADAQLALDRAKADLRSAAADLEQLRERATPQERQEAEARVAQAKAQYRQLTGGVSQADISAAQARLESARAQLAALEAGGTDTASAQTDLARAEAQFASQRDTLSLSKTNAELALSQSTNDLTQAQARYATAQQNWQYVQDSGADPQQPTTVDSKGRRVPNKINDTQRQQYYDTFVQAEAALRSAETSVQRAQVAFDQARQAEVTGIAAAQRDLETVQSRVTRLANGGQTSQSAQARAAVSEAQAQLNKLVGASRAAELEASQANVKLAELGLEKLNADPTASALARAEAGKARAEVGVSQAERDLARTTLTAPFGGTVARVDLKVGERAGQSALALADLKGLYVTVPIDELDIAQIKPGLPAKIVVDALPGQELAGTVGAIEPLATKNTQGTNTFQVKVSIDALDAGVRPGMTAATQIVTVRRENALLVPRRAVRTENGKSYVLVPRPAGTAQQGPQATPDPTTAGAPPYDKREVTTGLSNAEQVEILTGLKAGEQVLVQDTVSTFNPVGGP